MCSPNQHIHDLASNALPYQPEAPFLKVPSSLRKEWTSADDDSDDDSSHKSVATLSATSDVCDDSVSARVSQPPVGTPLGQGTPAGPPGPPTPPGLSESARGRSNIYGMLLKEVPCNYDEVMPMPIYMPSGPPLSPRGTDSLAQRGYNRPCNPRPIPRGPANPGYIPRGPANQGRVPRVQPPPPSSFNHLVGMIPNSMMPPQAIPRSVPYPVGPRRFPTSQPPSLPIAAHKFTSSANHMPQLSFTPMDRLRRQTSLPAPLPDPGNTLKKDARATRGLDPTSASWTPKEYKA
ncbi:hypothetical protein QQZ08_001452 [Neonectria magnoliae]|uniref:Uncharacterized protein n=1 Tax=Neonectria magnoliae TaxID=2732573 RepID=A0ABR1IEY8_9HYPO